jgi:hypothetical protein
VIKHFYALENKADEPEIGVLKIRGTNISIFPYIIVCKISMSTDSSNDSALQEWKETREVLKRFDEDHHDLRKYGFVFLASLLTADSIQAYLGLPLFTRFVLLTITIAFIVGLRLLDHDYQNFKEAANIRSRILEVSLNMELSETIDVHYVNEKWDKYINYLYDSFMAITILLGVAILFPKVSSFSLTITFIRNFLVSNQFYIFLIYLVLLLVVALVGIWWMSILSNDLCVKYARQDYDLGDFNDWTMDRVSCKQGEKVKSSVMNLHPRNNPKSREKRIEKTQEETVFHTGDIAFRIIDDEGNEAWSEQVKKEITLMNYGTYSWLWDTTNITPNKIYRVLPRIRKFPLSRSIIVYQKDNPQSSPPTNTAASTNPSPQPK